MLAGMSHRYKARIAETRFRGMNADAGTRKRLALRNLAYSTSKIFFITLNTPYDGWLWLVFLKNGRKRV